MSIVCNNTTPLVSKFSDLTTKPGQIIDLSALTSQADPLDRVDRATIIDVTNRLNGILDEAVGSSTGGGTGGANGTGTGGVTGTGGATDTGVDTVTGNTNNNNNGANNNAILLTDYPTLFDRFSQSPITFTEIAAFAIDSNIDMSDILFALENFNVLNGLSSTLTDFLKSLDFFLNVNFGSAINAGVCGQYQKILDLLSAGLLLLDNTIADLAGLTFPDLDITKLAISLAQKITLEEMKKKLLEAVDELVKKITKKIDDAIKGALANLANIIGSARAKIGKIIDKIQTEIVEFFSPENIQRIKDEVSAFITGMVSNFERPTLENVGLIMFKLCNFTEILKDMLLGPVDELNEIVSEVNKETAVLDTQDKVEEKKAVDAGAIRVDKVIAEEKKEIASEKINEAALDNNPNRYVVRVGIKNARGQVSSFRNEVKYRQPGELGYIDPSTGSLAIPTNVDYITLTVPSQDELQYINTRSKDGVGPAGLITFSDKVVSDEEWKGVDSSIWMRLLRLSSLTGEKYVLKQGQARTSSRSSSKTAGKVRQQGQSAYHHKYSGFAVELFVPADIREKTIIAASRVGFSGIAVGKSYLRLHLGARDGTVADESNLRWIPSERFASNETPIYNAMMRTHSIDGYRKRREPDASFRFYDKSTFKEEPSTNDGSGIPNIVDNTSITSKVEETEVPFSLLRPEEPEVAPKKKFVPPTGIVPFQPGSTLTNRDRGPGW